jgi:hypothetical protein
MLRNWKEHFVQKWSFRKLRKEERSLKESILNRKGILAVDDEPDVLDILDGPLQKNFA